MFLMNTSALVALQRQWEPFSQPRNYRYPVCFSESEDDLPRSAVSAKVQVIINNLQSEDSSLHSGSEYGCLVPKKPKVEKGQSHNVRRSGRVLQKRNLDDVEMEEKSEFGALLLPSDSDDSVDRDIEEAIQEFLKNKDQNVLPLQSGVSINEVVSDSLEDGTDQWVASPCSVSSDDSFEQSIEAEIEQFLNEKKQQQARKEATAEEKKRLDQKETQEKWVVTGQREATNRVSQSSPKRGDKAFFLRQRSHLQNVGTRCLKPETEGEVAGFKTSQIPLASHSLFLEQSREGEKGQKLWKTGGEQSNDVSDSSSDDGIEEAIQLYQLEKIRRASESRTACVPFQTEEDISSRLLIRSVNALSGKRRKLATKPEDLSRISGNSIGLDSRKNGAPTENSIATCALTLQTSCRADTTTELMCAEAILDISKTILPPPGGSNAFFCSRDGSASQHESDSNSVDSDDSIEQEIRAFLAVKAQTESLITKSDTRHLKRIPRKPFRLSLSHQRKLKGESKIVRTTRDTQQTLLEQSNKDGGDLRILQNTQKVARCSLDIGGSADPPFQRCETKSIQNPPKCGLDYKSSSLDSDEDLDTAIKELLRSKRKLKRKPKDPRAPCKKKVRFDDTATHILGSEERDCKSQKPVSLKSCLVNSQRVENTPSRNVVKGKPKVTKAIQFNNNIQERSKNNIWTDASLTDESSSVDSDDSIEQEIQRFLAEKSKSILNMDTPASNGIVGGLGACKSQAAEAKYQQFQGQSHAVPKQKGKMKKLGPPTINLRNSPRLEEGAMRNGEQIISYAINSQRIQGIAESSHPDLPVNRTVEGSQIIRHDKLDQKSLPTERSKAKKPQLQNCFEPLFQCRNSYEFKISSNFLSGLKNQNNRPILWGRSQSSELASFKRQGSVVPLANLPGEGGAMTPKWGSTSGKVLDLSTRSAAKGWQTYVADHNDTSLNSVTKIKFWGDQEACCSLGANQRSHLQGPKRQNMLKASTGLLCSKKKEGHNINLNKGKDTSSSYGLTLRGKSLRGQEEQPPKVIKVESL
ncbi:protein phosphatase 1 regulatory subunit 26 [Anolis sagrei]|uniref:protein phosphatase 1 regulatory subunit 26 n=1 Tax=Anolis sagrei TaxID=38937 RepID=UPI00352152BC